MSKISKIQVQRDGRLDTRAIEVQAVVFVFDEPYGGFGENYCPLEWGACELCECWCCVPGSAREIGTCRAFSDMTCSGSVLHRLGLRAPQTQLKPI